MVNLWGVRGLLYILYGDFLKWGVPQVIIQNWLSMGKTMVWGTHSFGNLHITWLIIGICGGFVTLWRLSPNLYQGGLTIGFTTFTIQMFDPKFRSKLPSFRNLDMFPYICPTFRSKKPPIVPYLSHVSVWLQVVASLGDRGDRHLRGKALAVAGATTLALPVSLHAGSRFSQVRYFGELGEGYPAW